MKLQVNCDKYKFDEVRHKHYIHNREVTGTTTIVGVLDKPALVPWAVKISMEKLKELGTLTDENIEIAKKAPNNKKTSAGTFGTVAHFIAEHFNKTGVVLSADSDELPKDIQDKAKELNDKQKKKIDKLINQFKDWLTDNKAKVIYAEQNVFSETHFIGGIFDMIIEKGGKTYIADFKTSSGVYPSHFIQMGGYDIQLEEMAERGYIEEIAPDGYIVFHVPQAGNMKVYEKTNPDHYRRAFRACLYLYRLVNDQIWAL